MQLSKFVVILGCAISQNALAFTLINKSPDSKIRVKIRYTTRNVGEETLKDQENGAQIQLPKTSSDREVEVQFFGESFQRGRKIDLSKYSDAQINSSALKVTLSKAEGGFVEAVASL